MATRHSDPGAQLIGVTGDRRKIVASFVKTKTAFGMAPGDTYAHSFDELKAFYACEDKPLSDAAAAGATVSVPAKVQRPLPGSYHIRQPNFVRFILPLLSLVDPAKHARIVELYWGLSLHRDEHLALAVVRLLAADKAQHSLAWCAFAANVRPNRRAVFVTLLAETGLGRKALARNAGKILLELETLTTRANYAAWLFTACTGILRGIDSGYLLAGFRIAATHLPWFAFGKLENCTGFDPEALDSVIARLRHSRSFYPRLPVVLWEACGELPGLGRLLLQVEWHRFRPAHARKLVHMMYALIYDEVPREKMLLKWQVFQGQFSAILDVVYAVPLSYKNKAIDFFEEYYWRFDDPYRLQEYHGKFCALVSRICCQPFGKGDILATFWCTLLECGSLPVPAVLLRLERFCRSKNSAWLVVRGIRAFRKIAPEFARTLVQTGNPRLLEICRLLGCMGRKQRYDVLLSLRDSALIQGTVTQENVHSALNFIDSYRRGVLQNPVPRKLRAYVRGEIRLSERALAGQVVRLNANLRHFRLLVLEQRIRASVRAHYGIAPEYTYDHALLVTNLIRENRHALRQLLSAHATGDHGYILRHAATQSWLKKVPGFNFNAWQRGFEMPVADEAVGTIRLAVEHDPLEKLKLGTYVGSCLGLGGSYTYSAAAAVLDINKHVVYARDPRGRVVARQLLCFSDEGKLVPFSVYPVGVTAAMQAHFAEFDRRYAAALGIHCYSVDKDGEYTIANIISRDWWDDGAWDMQAGE